MPQDMRSENVDVDVGTVGSIKPIHSHQHPTKCYPRTFCWRLIPASDPILLSTLTWDI